MFAQRAEEVVQAAERQLDLGLDAARAQGRGHFGQQGALADPGRAAQHQGSPVLDDLVDPPLLALPAVHHDASVVMTGQIDRCRSRRCTARLSAWTRTRLTAVAA
ncbi:hypothetical protein [Allokutzneria sp. NRRL B-24872]|uniref:hypothetical protein n=1 Tax=Allokutzneria sp. NRRL B-24872 TaxID=1137961 RepID=UPI000A37D527|nr:hypothetical protein [Allokutzneria sp. NRRL B-24872]